MNDDFIFRILFFVLLLAGGAIRGYYARKGQAAGKKRSTRERWREAAKIEGKVSVVLWVGNSVFLFIAITFYLLFSPWMLWSQLPFPSWLRWIGVGVEIPTLPFLIWVHHTLGKHWSPSLELKGDHTLVTSGPYSRVRHPMYTVHIVYFFALMLVSANLLLFIFFLIATILLFARIPKEEKMLIGQFGDEYRAYMKRTGGLLPRFRREADKEE